MPSKAFAAVAGNMTLSKNVESAIVGGPSLDEGTHDVTILAVDTTDVENNKLNVTYADADGKTYTDKMFTLSADQKEFSFGLRALWSAVLMDRDAIGKLIELSATDDKALEVLTGMKLRITLRPGKGVQARSTGAGAYAGYDVESNEKVTEDHPELRSVYDEVKGRGLKRSYMQVKKCEETNKTENVAAFNFAIAAKEKAKGGGTVSSFSAGKVG